MYPPEQTVVIADYTLTKPLWYATTWAKHNSDELPPTARSEWE